MSENNLPIKLVLPKRTDIVKNTGSGRLKFFWRSNSAVKKRNN